MLKPESAALRSALAEALERSGDGPEAADCFRQLAIGHLYDGHNEQALSAARRAVQQSDGQVPDRRVLIECLESLEIMDEAAEHRDLLIEQLLGDNRWDEARIYCLKALRLDSEDDRILGFLGRVTAHASEERLTLKDSDVLCVACQAHNHRRQDRCQSCQTPLHGRCKNCGNPVSYADPVCLICGQEPHLDIQIDEQQVDEVIAESGLNDSGHHSRIRLAYEHKQAGRYQEALDIWHDIGLTHQDNPFIHRHLRELEAQAHDATIEKAIQGGNRSRRQRHYYRAWSSYRRARRIMPPKDPRYEPLRKLISATRREHMRALAIYGAAIAILLGVLIILIEPQIRLESLRSDLQSAHGELSKRIAAGGGASTWQTITARLAVFETRAAELGDDGASELEPLRALIDGARLGLAREQEAMVTTAIGTADIKNAKAAFKAWRNHFRDIDSSTDAELSSAIAAAETTAELLTQAASTDPQRLDAARQAEKEARLAEALAQAEALSKSLLPAIAEEAAALTAALTKRRQRFITAMKAAQSENHLLKAEQALLALKSEAESWRMDLKLSQVQAQLDQADETIASAGADADVRTLQELRKRYPGSRQDAMLAERIRALEERLFTRDQELARLARLRAEGDWTAAYSAALSLRERYRELRPLLPVPILIDTIPPGARLLIDGQDSKRRSPCRIDCQAETTSELRIELPGHDPITLSITELLEAPRRCCHLQRSILDEQQLGDSIHRLLPNGIAIGEKQLLALTNNGSVSWRKPLPPNEEPRRIARYARTSTAHLLLPLANESSVLIYSLSGQMLHRYQPDTQSLGGIISAAPCLYYDPYHGNEPRIAFAGRTLYHGALGRELHHSPLPDPCHDGPIQLSAAGIQVLVLAGSRSSNLYALEESSATAEERWQFPVEAADINGLCRLSEDSLLAQLDGSRLLALRHLGSRAEALWTCALGGSAQAPPDVHKGRVYQRLDKRLLAIAEGQIQASWSCDSSIQAHALGAEHLALLSTEPPQLHVHGLSSDQHDWRRRLPSTATACRFQPGSVQVILADGRLITFALGDSP